MITRVHELVSRCGTIVFPGVYDALSAKIAEQAGFELAFVSGFAVSATLLGEPDFGLVTQTEMAEAARRICRTVKIPIIVDADTGYGNPLNVYRTVRDLIDAGAAGCFLEDQQWPKKCGHMRGKKVIERSEFIAKVRAAHAAREGHDFFIVARTDALVVHGMDEAIARVTEAREVGADGSFVEAPTTVEEMAEIGRRSPAPNVANMIVGGRTPLKSRDELASLGFHLIVHPLAGLFSAADVLRSTLSRLHCDGKADEEAGKRMAFDGFNQIVGLEQRFSFAQRFGVD